MKPFRLRTNITREKIGDFTLPLGITPIDLTPPQQGYTVTYTPGEEEVPDSYSFHIVVSHERVREIVQRAFGLLSEQVFGIIEIGSRDAYRATDVYIGEEALDREAFIESWELFEDFLLEDGSIGAGANSDDPFVEVFIDQWKGIAIHVPLPRRDEVEQILTDFGLEEVSRTWGEEDDSDSVHTNSSELRPVLELDDQYAPDVDELLLQLRHMWQMSLDIDPESNKDDSGRELGLTLWHVVVIAQSREEPEAGAYISIWLTAASANEVGEMVMDVLEKQTKWEPVDMFSLDRIAYDDRPEELSDIPPRATETKLHLVQYEPWSSTPTAEN